MEIRFLNVSVKDKNIKNLSLEIQENLITGIYGNKYDFFKNIFQNNFSYDGEVLVDNSIIYIDKEPSNFLTDNVSDEIELFIKSEGISKKSVLKYMDILGLTDEFLKRDISSLSKSEKKMFYISLNLSIIKDFVFWEEPFLYLDRNNIKRIKLVIKDLKKSYKKSVVLFNQDIDLLYEFSDNLILFKDNQILIQDSLDIVFKDIAFLDKNNISIPNSILFQENALKYGVSLKRSIDVKDLIKDVYRNEEARKNIH